VPRRKQSFDGDLYGEAGNPEESEAHASAEVIQASIKAHRVRINLSEEEKSVLKVQGGIRGRTARGRMKEVEADVARIQGAMNGKNARGKVATNFDTNTQASRFNSHF